MKHLYYSILLLFMCLSEDSHALSIFRFTYNQTISGRVVPCDALFLQHENGKGFLKNRYVDPQSGDKILLHMDLEDIYLKKGKTSIDTTKMYVSTKNVKVIFGKASSEIPMPLFLFTLSQQTHALQPTAVAVRDKNGAIVIDHQAQLKTEFLTTKQFTKEGLSQFFPNYYPFLLNLLKTKLKNFTPEELTTSVHLVIVADTLDEYIGASCAMDVRRVLESYQKIVNYIGAHMKVRMVVGESYSKRNVVSELKLLYPKKNDIVIFYYTGHGYRKETDKRRYPYLDLRCKGHDDYLKETLNMEDIYTYIKKKGARLNFVMSDCCNSYVGESNATSTPAPKKQSISVTFDSDHLRMLFLKAKMSILATAADSAQRATSNNTFGGFFSYFFNASLEASCSNTKTAYTSANTSPSWWNAVLSEARMQTEKQAQQTYCSQPYIEENICYQIPCYKIE